MDRRLVIDKAEARRLDSLSMTEWWHPYVTPTQGLQGSASPRTGPGRATGRVKSYPHTGQGRGLKKGEDPQGGGGSVNHSPPLHIYGPKQ